MVEGGEGGLSENVNHHGWLTKKNINDSKSHIWNSCFFKKEIALVSGIQLLYIRSYVQWTLSELSSIF